MSLGEDEEEKKMFFFFDFSSNAFFSNIMIFSFVRFRSASLRGGESFSLSLSFFFYNGRT